MNIVEYYDGITEKDETKNKNKNKFNTKKNNGDRFIRLSLLLIRSRKEV